MTLAIVLEIIQGVLKFPDQVLALVRILKGTPAEQQDAIMKQMEQVAHDFQATGRPTWTE